MKVICITGKAGHGKDTLAQFMTHRLEREGKRVLVAHFADLLKYICKQYFSWNGEKDEQGRGLLQYVGTDVMRLRAPGYLVGFVADMLLFFPERWEYVFLPDCRFPNEVEALRARGLDVITVRVHRQDYVSSLPAQQQTHTSETALDHFTADYFLPNAGSLDALERRAMTLLACIQEGGAHCVG